MNKKIAVIVERLDETYQSNILSGIHEFYEPEELVGKTLIAITNLPPRAMMGIESCGMLLSAIHEEEGEEKLHLLMVDRHIPAGAKLYQDMKKSVLISYDFCVVKCDLTTN